MPDSGKASIWALNDEQARDAGLALATALELEIGDGKVDTSDFDKLVAHGPKRERDLHQSLDAAALTDEETAAACRSLLLLAADLGYQAQVRMAVDSATTHERDFGVVSGPLLVAGLAVVLSLIPIEERTKVTKMHYRAADGSELEAEVTETEKIRAGPAVVEKLAGWWSAVIGG